MSQFLSHSPAETEDFGFRLAQQLKGGEVIAMYGGMGMGKTAFTRGLARGLGIEYGISSPTIALVHEYTGRLTVYHFDMFRVESWDDLYSTGFYDYLETDAVLVIEWSEHIEEALPKDCIKIQIALGAHENERIFTVEGGNL